MSRVGRNQNKGSAFWTVYFVYLIIIAVALVGVYFYVRGIMIEYENNSPEKYVVWSIKNADGSGSKVADYLEAACFDPSAPSAKYGDAAARKERFYSLAKDAELSAEIDIRNYDSAHPVYNVRADGEDFVTVALSEKSSTTKLGIMTISEWDIDYAVMHMPAGLAADISEDGTYTYEINMPSDFRLLIDGVETPIPADAVLSSAQEFDEVARFTEAPQSASFSLSGLSFTPCVMALNNGNEELIPEESLPGSFRFPADYTASPEAKELIEENLDPIEIGRLWSSFMTDDVAGIYHGLERVKTECRLVPGSRLCEQAEAWAHSVDITFVSGHRIDSWTGAQVENFIRYSDTLCSCDVYIEKNLTLTTAAQRTDIFNNRMYFVYLEAPENGEPGWYLADMYTLMTEEQ